MADATMLLRLQQVNLDLMRTRKQVEELPQKEQITKIRKATKRVSSELSRIMGVRKDLELAISDNEDDHLHVSELVDEAQKRAEGQQDYRAIRDLEGQLTAYAKRLEKLEFDRAHLEEQLASVQAKEQEYNAWLAKAKAEEDALLAAYKEDVESAGNRMNELLAEREELAGAMPQELLDRYVRASKRFQGLAVETLNGNKPSICRVALQPSQYAQLKSADGICECPYCHRILVVDEGEGEEEE